MPDISVTGVFECIILLKIKAKLFKHRTAYKEKRLSFNFRILWWNSTNCTTAFTYMNNRHRYNCTLGRFFFFNVSHKSHSIRIAVWPFAYYFIEK